MPSVRTEQLSSTQQSARLVVTVANAQDHEGLCRLPGSEGIGRFQRTSPTRWRCIASRLSRIFGSPLKRGRWKSPGTNRTPARKQMGIVAQAPMKHGTMAWASNHPAATCKHALPSTARRALSRSFLASINSRPSSHPRERLRERHASATTKNRTRPPRADPYEPTDPSVLRMSREPATSRDSGYRKSDLPRTGA